MGVVPIVKPRRVCGDQAPTDRTVGGIALPRTLGPGRAVVREPIYGWVRIGETAR
jgi:hypothetical protein